MRRDDVLEDWALLRSTGCDVPSAARRIGISTEALLQHLRRGRAAGDPRAVFTYDGCGRRSSDRRAS